MYFVVYIAQKRDSNIFFLLFLKEKKLKTYLFFPKNAVKLFDNLHKKMYCFEFFLLIANIQ